MASRKSTQPIDLSTRVTLTIPETAAALGVSENHVRNHIHELPCLRMGDKSLIPVEALKEWVDKKAKYEQRTVDDIANGILKDVSPERCK